jgi:hypothetical protein
VSGPVRRLLLPLGLAALAAAPVAAATTLPEALPETLRGLALPVGAGLVVLALPLLPTLAGGIMSRLTRRDRQTQRVVIRINRRRF